MGIFKKIGKGIKTAFNSIGKKVKKAFKSFGKFMGEIGILGQIAMMFILPGIGNALMGALGGMFTNVVGQTAAQGAAAAASTGATATAAATAKGASLAAAKAAGATAAKGIATKASGLLGSKVALLRGAGTVLKAAGNFVKVGSSAFSTVTEGISTFVSEFGKTALNKVPGITIDGAASTFGGAWGTVQESVMANADKTLKAWNAAITSPTAVPAPASTVPTTAVSPTTAVETPGRPVPNDVDWVNLEAIGDKTNLNALNAPDAVKPYSEESFDTLIAEKAKGLNIPTQTSTAVKPVAPENNTLTDDLRARGISRDGKMLEGQNTRNQVAPEESLLSRVGTALQDLPEKLKNKVVAKIDSFPEELVENSADAIENRLFQAAGLKPTPEYTSNQYVTKAYVPPASSFPGAQLPLPTMTAEDYLGQVALSPYPYGNTAYQHENYMSRTATG